MVRPLTGADSGARSDDTPPADAREPGPGTRPTPPADTTPAPIPALPQATPADPDLAAVVRAWPDLPLAIRAGVLALVKAATPTAPEGGAA